MKEGIATRLLEVVGDLSFFFSCFLFYFFNYYYYYFLHQQGQEILGTTSSLLLQLWSSNCPRAEGHADPYEKGRMQSELYLFALNLDVTAPPACSRKPAGSAEKKRGSLSSLEMGAAGAGYHSEGALQLDYNDPSPQSKLKFRPIPKPLCHLTTVIGLDYIPSTFHVGERP